MHNQVIWTKLLPKGNVLGELVSRQLTLTDVFHFFSFFSEMFMDTNKFSTKTLSAINGLEGAVIRKNKEYNWRKEMEQ